jgi:hypothetical protein
MISSPFYPVNKYMSIWAILMKRTVMMSLSSGGLSSYIRQNQSGEISHDCREHSTVGTGRKYQHSGYSRVEQVNEGDEGQTVREDETEALQSTGADEPTLEPLSGSERTGKIIPPITMDWPASSPIPVQRRTAPAGGRNPKVRRLPIVLPEDTDGNTLCGQ